MRMCEREGEQRERETDRERTERVQRMTVKHQQERDYQALVLKQIRMLSNLSSTMLRRVSLVHRVLELWLRTGAVGGEEEEMFVSLFGRQSN